MLGLHGLLRNRFFRDEAHKRAADRLANSPQYGFTRVRFRSLAKKTTQQNTLFALSNLYLARNQMLLATG